MENEIIELVLSFLIDSGMAYDNKDISIEDLKNILKKNGMKSKKMVKEKEKVTYINKNNQRRVVTELNDFKEYIINKYKIDSNLISKENLLYYKEKEKYSKYNGKDNAPWFNYINNTFK